MGALGGVCVAEQKVLSPSKRAELCALLVGADLESVTVGQARAELERRLGLQAGSLACKSHQLDCTATYEVLRQLHSNAACEQIAKVLVGFRQYPRSACLMLLEGLPSALVPLDGSLHAHQLQFLSMVRDALCDAQHHATHEMDACEAQLHITESELQHFTLREELSRLVALRTGPFRMLLDGTLEVASLVCLQGHSLCRFTARLTGFTCESCGDEQLRRTVMFGCRQCDYDLCAFCVEKKQSTVKDSALVSVRNGLDSIQKEESLIVASLDSLSRHPQSRTLFQTRVIESVEKAFSDRISAIGESLEQNAHSAPGNLQTVKPNSELLEPFTSLGAATEVAAAAHRAASDNADLARKKVAEVGAAISLLEELVRGAGAKSTGVAVAADPEQATPQRLQPSHQSPEVSSVPKVAADSLEGVITLKEALSPAVLDARRKSCVATPMGGVMLLTE